VAEGDPFLSIIVPFHNAACTSGPLLDALSRLKPDDDVEVILVDDGSTDATLPMLQDLARTVAVPVIIIEQENGGPGAARNSGLDRAGGRFVWFVDADDRIELGAIDLGKERAAPGVDLIAWGWEHPTIRRSHVPGVHGADSKPFPSDTFDPVVANWFAADFLRRTDLRFPENCVYEATPIEAFVLPLLVSRYQRIDFTAYRVSASENSVTRKAGLPGPRFYDRLQTIPLGFDYLQQAAPEVRAEFEAAFIRLFLWYSIRLSKLPDRSWLVAARVMRKFRDEARRFGISGDPFDHYPGRPLSRFVLRALWALSASLPSQDRYFNRLHMRSWNRPVSWKPPFPPPADDGESCLPAPACP
jgi:glycosyltransferase involved in cell wall biosynthesis